MTAAATWQISPMVWIVLAVQAVGIIGSIAVVKHIAKGAEAHMGDSALHVSPNNGYVPTQLCTARHKSMEDSLNDIKTMQNRILDLLLEERH